MEEKLVSVIIPTYRRANLLTRAIDSVLNQTYHNLEIIVVDDNDPETEFRENTKKIMSQYKDKLRVKYIKHNKNKNGAAARNTGINNAKGEYISFLDDDDWYLPNKLKLQVEYLKNNLEYNGVYSGYIKNGKKITAKLKGNLTKQLLLLALNPYTSTMMFRKFAIQRIGGFNEKFLRHQDYDLLIRFFKRNLIGVINEPLVNIGQNEGENELHGKVLEKNKKLFLEQFKNEITDINKKDKKFKKNVFIAHYVSVFFDHLSQKYIFKAIDVYFRGINISLIKFNISIIKYIYKYLRFVKNKTLKK